MTEHQVLGLALMVLATFGMSIWSTARSEGKYRAAAVTLVLSLVSLWVGLYAVMGL